MVNWNKIKPKLNLIIDAIMFIDLAAVAGLGFLMKYVLLPGYKINEIYGTDTELYFRGLDRHQWGAIHLYLALFLVFLLVLHIIFHWGPIICIFKQMIASRKLRVGITVLLVITGLLLFSVSLFVKPEVAQLERKHNRNRVPGIDATHNYQAFPDTQQPLSKPSDNSSVSAEVIPPEKVSPDSGTDALTKSAEAHRHNQVDIDGTMTLNQISQRYNISVDELAGAINVPSIYANERLGRLKKRYQFEIDEIRIFVSGKSQNTDN